MYASTTWLNDYLEPPATAEEQGHLLTMAGFPLEGTEEIDLGSGNKDVCQDFEMTSNRGDCVSHIGLAREIAAISKRKLKLPSPEYKTTGPATSELISVSNHEKEKCPLYTCRIIHGVKVGPSPQWLADRLKAIGQIPRNNIVDATNFVLFEFGQPTHVFDLAKIKNNQIIIRMAAKDEPFLPIGEGEKEIKLTTDDLVIADAEVPVAIGGVKGGAMSAVTENTTDILIEAATFNQVTVRNSVRRYKIESASAYRYERGVHPAHVNPAAERLIELLLEVAGGELCAGVVSDGAPIPELKTVSMRLSRCKKILGLDITDEEMVGYLDRLGFQPRIDGDVINSTAPCHRLDIVREIDVIEEVSRMFGHENIPIADSIPIRIAPPQPYEEAKRTICDSLVGMGFIETVTHSLASEKEAQPFLHNGMDFLRVDDERAKSTPILRPSLMASLLHVRAFNRNRGVNDLKLFESAATFIAEKNNHIETRKIGMIADIADSSMGLRPMRGVIDRLVHTLLGGNTAAQFEQTSDINWLNEDSAAVISVNGKQVGWMGLLNRDVLSRFDLDIEVAAAEIELESFYNNFPPDTEVSAPPEFPSIERDISVVLDENTKWDSVRELIDSLDLEMLNSVMFVTTYRGKQIDKGQKSLTLRLCFRAADRTLKHEEIDPQVVLAVNALQSRLGGVIRE